MNSLSVRRGQTSAPLPLFFSEPVWRTGVPRSYYAALLVNSHSCHSTVYKVSFATWLQKSKKFLCYILAGQFINKKTSSKSPPSQISSSTKSSVPLRQGSVPTHHSQI